MCLGCLFCFPQSHHHSKRSSSRKSTKSNTSHRSSKTRNGRQNSTRGDYKSTTANIISRTSTDTEDTQTCNSAEMPSVYYYEDEGVVPDPDYDYSVPTPAADLDVRGPAAGVHYGWTPPEENQETPALIYNEKTGTRYYNAVPSEWCYQHQHQRRRRCSVKKNDTGLLALLLGGGGRGGSKKKKNKTEDNCRCPYHSLKREREQYEEQTEELREQEKKERRKVKDNTRRGKRMMFVRVSGSSGKKKTKNTVKREYYLVQGDDEQWDTWGGVGGCGLAGCQCGRQYSTANPPMVRRVLYRDADHDDEYYFMEGSTVTGDSGMIDASK